MKKILIFGLSIFSLVFTVIQVDAAEVYGCIKGRVLNAENGIPLYGANVIIVDTEQGTISNKDGHFILKRLRMDTYTIRVTFMGFTTVEKSVALKSFEAVVDFRLRETLLDMEKIVVTATRTEKTLKDVPILTELISRRQLETTGVVTVQDALEELPSLEFSPNSHGANIMMHGLGPKYVLFLVDGERIAGEVRGNIDFSRLNTANIERIEIVKGAASSLYGSNAIGGVINIITQEVKHPLELNLHSRISKYNELTVGGTLGLKRKWFTSKTDIVRKSTDGYDLDPLNKSRHTVEKYEDVTITQKFTVIPTERLKLTAGGNYYVLERFDAARKYKHKHRKCYGTTYNGTAQYRFKKQAFLEASWHSDTYDTKEVYEKLQDEERLSYKHRYDNIRLMSNFQLGEKHQFTVGTEVINEKVFSTRITGETHKADDWVLFAQDDIKWTHQWSFVSGFRFDQHSEYGSHFCPKISGMYQILPFNFRATYGLGFKAPTLKELYMNWDHGGGGPYVYGNTDLKPETSNYGSFSIEFINRNLNWSVSLFRTDLKDMIATRIAPDDPNTHCYGNVARAMTQGAELLMKVDVGLGIALSGGYCFVDTEDKETGRELFGRAKHSGLVKLEYINNKYGFNFNLRGKLIGEKLIDEYEDEATGAIIQYNQAPYAIWRFNFNKKIFSYFNLNFGVDNLFDYMDKAYLVTPGRRYYGGIYITYK
ncbi:MAG: TonB-dependent receptor [Candidatus Marinimicrobia bacterium]|nr:TonB-dependent receptor [Candidatus Neomarinimicrobiota bacterium]